MLRVYMESHGSESTKGGLQVWRFYQGNRVSASQPSKVTFVEIVWNSLGSDKKRASVSEGEFI